MAEHRSLGNVIADSLELGIAQANRLLTNVTAEQFARFGRPGGQIVESNHAAFIFGHLSLYGPRIVEQLGGDTSTIQISDRFQSLFSADAKCQDDPGGTLYPPMEEITAFFFKGYRAAVDTLRAASDETLQQPNPRGGRMAELFPTLGSVHNFYCSGHLMLHLGQMSAWRRMMGLGPA
jgi:hypothetical protein